MRSNKKQQLAYYMMKMVDLYERTSHFTFNINDTLHQFFCTSLSEDEKAELRCDDETAKLVRIFVTVFSSTSFHVIIILSYFNIFITFLLRFRVLASQIISFKGDVPNSTLYITRADFFFYVMRLGGRVFDGFEEMCFNTSSVCSSFIR